MTPREHWQAIMSYGEFDRPFAPHWGEWPETRERWLREGLPPDASVAAWLGATPRWDYVEVEFYLFPAFEEESLEETDEYRVFRDSGGVVQQDWRHRSCIPHFIDHTLKTAADWPEYKRRLQPDLRRLPDDLDDRIARAEGSGLPVNLRVPSLMGWLRNWMGVEGFSYIMFDDPLCFAEMVDTLADLACWVIDEVCPRMAAPADLGYGWEDMCGRNGPLISPGLFEKYAAPGYRKVRDRLDAHGVPLYGVDCDGRIDAIVGPWLEAGVNLQFPVEIGPWETDPMALRRTWGRELRLMGGIDKRGLAQGREAIDAEIARRVPLMRDGGYVPVTDHHVPPDVSLDNYRYYLERVQALRL